MKILLLGAVLVLAAGAAFGQYDGQATTAPSPGTQVPTVIVETPVGQPPAVMAVSPEVELFNRMFLSRYYGLSEGALMDLRARGYTWAEINFMANLSQRTQRPITEIAMLRSQGFAWSDIGLRYNVALTELSQPVIIQTRVAGFVAEVGALPPPYYLLDRMGNPVLTARQAEMLKARGYEWRSIAVAANISARTGFPIRDILQMADRGMTWNQIAIDFGLNPAQVLDVSAYPFTRDPVLGIGYEQRVERQQLRTAEWYGVRPVEVGPPIGAGPGMEMPPMAAPTMPTSPAPATTAPNY